MVIVIPNRNYQPGVIDVPSTAVETGLTRLVFTLDRTQWLNPAITLLIVLERSLDGGATWTPQMREQLQGGQEFDRDGNLMTTSFVTTTFREPENPNRRLRGALTLVGGALRTSGTVEIT